MPTQLSINAPVDFALPRDLCSYGYFLLEPNHWDPSTATYTTTLDLAGGAVTIRVKQRAAKLTIRPDRPLTRDESAELRRQVARILNLHESADTIAEFHRVDPRFAAEGRGRLMRSASFFEDVIKTVTSCNVTWPSTVIMNRRLCQTQGRVSASGLHAFPTAAKLARVRPASLRARCSVGYRDARIVELAKMFVRGDVNPVWYENPETDESDIYDALLELPGVGPYAAANIMQLLGRYSRLPLDTESVRHGKAVLGFTGTPAQITKKVHRHYEPFGEHKFRSYWFELWEHYERKRGPAHTWERETTGKTFTAALLK